jgi:ribosomal protein S6E (S10)
MRELREIPARIAGVESQIVQLRQEMQESFSAIRSELGEKADGRQIDGLRVELLTEIRGGDQATQNFMKVLFEHHQANLRTIGEGTPRKGRKP